MKKLFLIPLVLVLVGAFIVTGCPAKVSPEKPVEIIFQAQHPRPQYLTQQSILPWVMGFEEKSGGRLKMTYYDADAVVKVAGAMDGIASNIIQMGVTLVALEPGRYPLADVMSLPLIASSSTIGSLVAWHLYEKFPECQAQYPDEVKVLTKFVSAAYQIHTVDEPITAVAQLKGKKMIGIDPWSLKVIKEVGAIPISVTMADSYEALEKGMAEGIFCPLAPIRALKVSEVTKYHTIIDLSYGTFTISINRSVFDGLPADLQQLFIDESEAKISEANGYALDEGALLDCQWMKEQGGTFYKLSEEEMAKFVELVLPIREEWIAEMEGKGLPGRAVFDEALRYAKELEAQGKYVPDYPTE